MASSYRIEGSYYEACNCEVICPCRQQNTVANGLTTYGTCDFILSWHIAEGQAGEADLSGLSVGIVGHYSDHEPGSPWSVAIYIDTRAEDEQFAALEEIFRGDAGGNMAFTGNFKEILRVKRAQIALDHSTGAESIKIGKIGKIALAEVVKTVVFDGSVSCGISGHDHPGQESVSNSFSDEGPLKWDYKGRCGFATDFAYFT